MAASANLSGVGLRPVSFSKSSASIGRSSSGSSAIFGRLSSGFLGVVAIVPPSLVEGGREQPLRLVASQVLEVRVAARAGHGRDEAVGSSPGLVLLGERVRLYATHPDDQPADEEPTERRLGHSRIPPR